MCDIFISYRRTLGTKYREPLCNKECEIQKERLSLTSLPIGSYAARILYDYLTSKNFSVFYDKESINFGEKYREKIKEEINQKARVFILVLTKMFLTDAMIKRIIYIRKFNMRCLRQKNSQIALLSYHSFLIECSTLKKTLM